MSASSLFFFLQLLLSALGAQHVDAPCGSWPYSSSSSGCASEVAALHLLQRKSAFQPTRAPPHEASGGGNKMRSTNTALMLFANPWKQTKLLSAGWASLVAPRGQTEPDESDSSTNEDSNVSEMELGTFSGWDTNSDGCVDFKELLDVATSFSYGIDPVTVETGTRRLFQEADGNGDGKITLDEAVAEWGPPKAVTPEGIITQQFQRMDGDKDGFIDPEDLRGYRLRMFDFGDTADSEQAWRHFCEVSDSDGDGRVSLEEALSTWDELEAS